MASKADEEINGDYDSISSETDFDCGAEEVGKNREKGHGIPLFVRYKRLE